MPMWSCGSVESEPSVRLARWKIVEIDAGTRHFVGANALDFTGRVSSAIVEFDVVAKRGTTRSGRVYQLVGAPGQSEDADYVWNRWCIVNSVRSFNDVTRQVFSGTGDGE